MLYKGVTWQLSKIDLAKVILKTDNDINLTNTKYINYAGM